MRLTLQYKLLSSRSLLCVYHVYCPSEVITTSCQQLVPMQMETSGWEITQEAEGPSKVDCWSQGEVK